MKLGKGICCREVLGRLLQQYAPMVRAICARRLGCSHCEDLQQEAFLRVIRTCHRVRDPRHLPSYLRTVATNLCADRIRERRTRGQPAQADGEVLENLADPDQEGDFRTSALLREMALLPEGLRRVVELFYFEQQDYAAIADRTGLTVGAVGQRLSRARRRLRNAIRRAG